MTRRIDIRKGVGFYDRDGQYHRFVACDGIGCRRGMQSVAESKTFTGRMGGAPILLKPIVNNTTGTKATTGCAHRHYRHGRVTILRNSFAVSLAIPYAPETIPRSGGSGSTGIGWPFET